MLKEVKNVDLIEILENGVIQVREVNKVFRDDAEIAKEFRRYILMPGDQLEGQPERVIAVAKVVWTKELIINFKTNSGIKKID
jgi:hypothetical protein